MIPSDQVERDVANAGVSPIVTHPDRIMAPTRTTISASSLFKVSKSISSGTGQTVDRSKRTGYGV